MAGSDPEQIGAADLVVGLIPPLDNGPIIGDAVRRITQLVPQLNSQPSSPAQALLIHPPISAGTGAPPSNPPWRLMADNSVVQDPTALAQSFGDGFRVIFNTARKAGARTCVVIASDLSTVTADWVQNMMQPVAELHFDLAAPCYARHPFEGLINRAIIYPLVRALYGKSIRNPFGPDFGISSDLLERMTTGSGVRIHPLASLVTEASTAGMNICQVHLGTRILPKPDWRNLSSLLSQVLAPLFLDVERCAAHWQHTRRAEAIPEFGVPISYAGPESGVETARLIESFGLGTRNLAEVWALILPPSAIVELRRLARQEPGAFCMPDETWARVVYDFALAYRLRVINRDQMLRAMTPIYVGWVASYALELENATPEEVEQRLERLCVAFENTKPYFISRWRWPDRFNP
jgi:hypothetical protein